ncbi:hypothetical protein MPH_09609 [Macrophomina phaseolina MS6]|uniref:Uncharacterized protein n=1 Tax=Macrophomina phaseolina (strain MS6) TaxID=1126212 RepID=K2RKE6_MACPH|nr:hypothetical protein MPH_09609 [Macrophomina phaseolina MS6]
MTETYTKLEEQPPPYVPTIRPNKSLPELPKVRSLEEGSSSQNDFSTPMYYTRDARKLVGYVIPFPKPLLEVPVEDMPGRFLIYTPPPPPLRKPAEGEKEGMVHKMQRKWQEEVRDARDNSAQRTRWQNIKSKTTRGVDWCMNQTTSSDVDFLVRIDAGSEKKKSKEKGKKDKKKSKKQEKKQEAEQQEEAEQQAEQEQGQEQKRSDSLRSSRASVRSSSDRLLHDANGSAQAKLTEEEEHAAAGAAGLSEIVLAYPSTLPGTPESIREEFVNKTLRTKSKTQREAIIASGLLPFSVAADILMSPFLPFVPLMQVNAAWAFFAVRGSQAAKKATKSLELDKEDEGQGGDTDSTKSKGSSSEREERIKFTFRPAPGLEVLEKYLAAACQQKDEKLFAEVQDPPTERDFLEAIGWSPSLVGQGEASEGELAAVEYDVKQVMVKAAGEWRSWCKAYAKNPEKAVRK